MQFLNEFLMLKEFIFIFIGVVIFHLIAVNSNIKYKKISVIIISVLAIGYLDLYTLFLLSLLAFLIYLVIKKNIYIKDNLLFITILCILILLIIKDYGVLLGEQNYYIPLGISYYYFRLLSLLIDYSNNKIDKNSFNLLSFSTYVFFFPIFLAGPIQRYIDFKEVKCQNYYKNYRWFLVVLSIKLLVVDAILFEYVYSDLMNKVLTLDQYDRTYFKEVAIVSVFGILAFIHAYLDLMLYTEMSKSLSRILGFSVQENFNKPLLATNISAFWQSWHMSLSNWTRDYIFFPMLLKTKKIWLSTYASMMTIGLWHSSTLNWILWALAHATAINLYGKIRHTHIFRSLSKRKLGRISLNIFGNLFTIYFVSVVFIFVAIHDFKSALKVFGKLFMVGG